MAQFKFMALFLSLAALSGLVGMGLVWLLVNYMPK